MSNNLYFSLKLLPDLTLNKYQSLGENGVDGVLERHSSFLRLWHRVSMLFNSSLHLMITYDPKFTNGNKFRVGLLLDFKGSDIPSSEKVFNILSSSPLSDFYKFEQSTINITGNYKYKTILYKKERFLTPLKTEKSPEHFYVVPAWKTNEGARLYDMLRMMEALDVPAVYRVDLYPRELSESMQAVFLKPLTWLRERTGMRVAQSINLTGEKNQPPKDPAAEETLDQYEEFLKSLDSSPHFQVNINCFSDTTGDCRMILDAAASEAIDTGDYQIKMIQGEFDGLSDIGKDPVPCFNGEKAVPAPLQGMATVFTLEDVNPFFRLPALYDGESIAMPKETNPVLGTEGIKLGVDEAGYDVRLPLGLLPKHAFVSGVPGSGKTNTMLHIAYELWVTYRIPFLVLEPAKQEYRALATADIPELLIFSPSSKTKFPLLINPFEFPKGITLSEHIRQIMQVFEGAFSLYPPMPFLLDRAIESIYRKHKWVPQRVNDGQLEYPTMEELFEQLKKEIDDANYQGEMRSNMQAALEMRIGSLLRREMGDVFNVKKSSLAPEEWLEMPAVIELETMGAGPANFTTLLLCTLIRETLKANPNFSSGREARHVIFIEEAHNLIGTQSEEVSGEDANPKVAATAFIVKMLAEVRALKEGIIIADQLPTAMAPEVLKNTGLKIAQRMTAADDRSILGSTMSASPLQLEQMASFSPGQALVTYEKVLKPFGVQIEQIVDVKVSRQSPDDQELFSLLIKNNAFKSLLSRTVSAVCEKYLERKRKSELSALGILNMAEKNLEELEQVVLGSAGFQSQDARDRAASLIEDGIRRLKVKQTAVKNILHEMVEELAKFRGSASDIGLYSYIGDVYQECRKDITFIAERNKALLARLNKAGRDVSNI